MNKYILHCNLTCYDTQGGGNFYSKPTTVVKARNVEEAKEKAKKQFEQQYENFRTKVGSVTFALIRELEEEE